MVYTGYKHKRGTTYFRLLRPIYYINTCRQAGFSVLFYLFSNIVKPAFL